MQQFVARLLCTMLAIEPHDTDSGMVLLPLLLGLSHPSFDRALRSRAPCLLREV